MSLEREIEDLLAVDPSPEFVAKVRQGIAAEPAPSSWWLTWRPVTAGVGLAAVVAAGLLWPSAAPVVPRDDGANAPATNLASAPTREADTVDTPSPSRAAAARKRRPVSAVVIRQDEAAAVNLLLTRVREGTLPDMTEALAAVDGTGPEWIAIPPVVIAPIATGEGE